MGTRTLEVPARSEVCASSAAPDPNSNSSLAERAHRGTLRWAGPLMVVVGRSVFMIAAQVVAVAVIWLRSHTWSWTSAAKWWTVYGTLVDVGCLALMAVVHTQGRNPAPRSDWTPADSLGTRSVARNRPFMPGVPFLYSRRSDKVRRLPPFFLAHWSMDTIAIFMTLQF